ncbi:MAG: hypothetical protein GKS02_10785 [Alphaproteobacteria bacterium]|nr:hypothetical protein [Alphaproteobacteria bacterium]
MKLFGATQVSGIYLLPQRHISCSTGNMVSRGFCPTCGSAIHSTNSGMPDLAFPRASSLDDLEVFQPQLIVYAERDASWDKMDPDLPAFEGMPPQDMPDM